MINNFNIITRFIDSYKSKLSINTINLINEKKYSELWIYHNNNYYDIIETPITKDYIQKLKINTIILILSFSPVNINFKLDTFKYLHKNLQGNKYEMDFDYMYDNPQTILFICITGTDGIDIIDIIPPVYITISRLNTVFNTPTILNSINSINSINSRRNNILNYFMNTIMRKKLMKRPI